jgi:hypothetical protein
MPDVKQLSLPQFIKEYNMPRVSVYQLIHTHGFPAYKLGGRWYVSVPEFEKWRAEEHRRQYKYAR